MIREALASVLRDRIPGVRLFVVPDAAEALMLMTQVTGIDVILADFYLPGMEGPQMLRRMTAERPDIPIVVLSATENHADIDVALGCGAVAFVHKSFNGEALAECVMRVLSGQRGMIYSAERKHAAPIAQPSDIERCIERLTPRQTEVLALIGLGMRNTEIADHLSTTEKNVKMHVSAILRVLAVPNRTCAALAARQCGLVAPARSGKLS